MSELEQYSEKNFEDIKHVNEYGQEFWYARELGLALEYTSWQNFFNVIQRAIQACETSGFHAADHFNDVIKMVNIGSDSQREVQDFVLSRYACYLVVMNGDPRKEVIALGQTTLL